MALLILIAFILLVAVISPLLIVYSKSQYPLELLNTARRLIVPCVFVLLVILVNIFGISLANQNANIAIVVFALASSGLLSLLSFKLKPKFLGIVTGLVSVLSGFLLMFYLLIGLVTEDISPETVQIDNETYCQQAFYGFVGTDSGTTLKIFKRHLFVDKLLINKRNSDITPVNSNFRDIDEAIVHSCWVAFRKNIPTSKITKTSKK